MAAANNDFLWSLFTLTQVPIWRINTCGELTGSWGSFEEKCMANFSAAVYKNAVLSAKAKKKPILFHGKAGEKYACVFAEKDSCCYLAGPVLKYYSESLAHAGIPCFQYNEKSVYEACIRQLPVLPALRFCHAVTLLCGCLGTPCEPAETLYHESQLDEDAFMDLDFTDFLFRQREKIVPHDGYSRERILLDCVKRGDHKHLEETLRSITSQPYGATLSDDEREQALFTLIACTTLVTRYAIEGGLEQDTAYTMSDYYIRRAKKCTSKQEMKEILYAMSMDFTIRVAAAEPQREFSHIVTQMSQYILSNLHYEITLEELASTVNRSKSYISALFKKETGKTVTQYIRQERLKEAKNLLVNTNKTCQEIATTLAFSGQSYFTEIFRAETGMTPTEYRTSQISAYTQKSVTTKV